MSGSTPTARTRRRRPSSPLGAVAAGVWWLAVAAACAAALPAVAAAAWQAPVDGEVVRGFDFAAGAPYGAGQHRGVDLAARPGRPVVAPCAGRVTFAGHVPRHGRGVTIACGRYAATVLALTTTRVTRGALVARGFPLGVSGPDPVHLGARRRGHRHGYVDPLPLLTTHPAPPPLVPPTRGPKPPTRPRPAPAPRAVPAGPSGALWPAAGAAPAGEVLAPAPLAVRAARPVTQAVPARGTPVVAWVGLALLAAALPTGALVRHRRRATTAAGREVAAA